MSKLLQAEKEHSTVTILVDRELRDRLVRTARRNERSLGAEVRVALREHLSDDQEEDEA
jgi:hypothetical protein